MGALGMQSLGQAGEKGVDVVDVEFGAVRMEGLDEPTHVGALERGRQVDRQRDGGHGVLRRVRFVPEPHRET